jgi:hypothetical protein
VDDETCPKCGAKATTRGRFHAPNAWGQRFSPDGMKFFDLSLVANEVDCPGPVRACLACGHIWADLDPEGLRAYIDKHGKAEARAKLEPFRKGPPERDLV